MISVTQEKYSVTKEILGKGTYGLVYKARRNSDRKAFAFKEFSNDTPDLDLGVLREVSVMSIFKNNNYHIVDMVDIVVSDSTFGIIQKKYERDLSYGIGNLTAIEKKIISRQLLIAVAFMHSNEIIHRDIKPENILLDKKNNAYLTDFTLSKVFTGPCTDMTHTGKIVTATYRAPEVCTKKSYTLAVDSWSIGVTLYELYKGKRIPVRSDKLAINYLSKRKFKDTPLGNMVAGLLKENPLERLTPEQALRGEYFSDETEFHPIWMSTVEGIVSEEVEETCHYFNAQKRITRLAAQAYIDRTDCECYSAVILACKVYEVELVEIEDDYDYPLIEREIFKKMNYNLFV